MEKKIKRPFVYFSKGNRRVPFLYRSVPTADRGWHIEETKVGQASGLRLATGTVAPLQSKLARQSRLNGRP